MATAITYASRAATGRPAAPDATHKSAMIPNVVQEATSPIAVEAVPSGASEEMPDELHNTSSPAMRRKPRRYHPVKLSLGERYDRKKKELAQCAADLEQAQLACDAFKRELRIEREKSQKLALQRDDLNMKLSESNNNLESERRLRAAADDLLSKRSAELDATKALLPSSESITDTRIVDLFQDLNYEIAQSVTTLAEAYENATRVRSSTKIQPDVKACFEACGALPLLRLPPKSAMDPTTALQIGLQAALTTFAQAFLDDGVYENMPGMKRMLVALKENEPELVAGRWSALAHQYARNTAKDYSEQQLLRRLASLLGDALAMAGCGVGKDSSESRRTESVLSKAEDPLLGVARLLLELDVILGEKVAVGWMESFAAARGESFQKESMDAAFQGDAMSKKERVLCSTALGLRRVVKGETTVLLKPMVALSSLLPGSTPDRRRPKPS